MIFPKYSDKAATSATRGVLWAQQVNQDGLISITADLYLTIVLHVYEWISSAINWLTSQTKNSFKWFYLTITSFVHWKSCGMKIFFSFLFTNANQKYLSPKHKVSSSFYLSVYRYITSQSWQCPAHSSQQNEHVPAPLHHQHHAPSQPQATAHSCDQNHEQEFNCKFKCFIKLYE